MKNINFINTLTRQQYYALRRWWLLSGVLCVGILLVMSVLHGLQLHQWYRLRIERETLASEVTGMRAALQEHDLLSKKQQHLQQKKVKADHVKESLVSLRARLIDLTTACAGSQLESCKWHKSSVEMVVGCKDALSATECVSKVQKIKGLTGMRLVSVSPQQQGMVLATMKAQLGKA